jgi:hypothetical protein
VFLPTLYMEVFGNEETPPAKLEPKAV